MTHDGDTNVNHALNGGRHACSALKLHTVTIGLHQYTAGAADSLLRTLLISAEGHVACNKGVGGPLHHRTNMMDHVVKRDTDG